MTAPQVATADRRRWWRALTAVVVVAGAIALVVANRADARDAWSSMRTARPLWLGLALALAVAWALNQGALHAAAQRAVGSATRPGDLVVVALSGTFLNLVTKSGGMAGLAAFTADGDRRAVPRPRAVAAYVLVVVLGELAFAATLVAAIGVVAADGRLSRNEVVATAIFVVYFAARMTLVVAATRSRSATRRLTSLPRRLADRLRRRRPPEAGYDTGAADELFDALALVRSRPAASVPALGHALLVEVVGVVMLWAVMQAVGLHLPVAAPFVAYAVSVLFTIVGVLPGGLGFVEVSLGAVLVSFGATAAAAAAVVVLYRVLELWLPLVAGAVATAHLRRRRWRP